MGRVGRLHTVIYKLLNVLYINQSALRVLHELAFSFNGRTQSIVLKKLVDVHIRH